MYVSPLGKGFDKTPVYNVLAKGLIEGLIMLNVETRMLLLSQVGQVFYNQNYVQSVSFGNDLKTFDLAVFTNIMMVFQRLIRVCLSII